MRWIFAVALVAACSGSGPSGGDDAAAPSIDAGGVTGAGSVFDPSITRVALEIDYETGEEPFTGPILGFGDTFDLTIANLDRLFGGRKTLDVPATTAAMEDIGAVADEQIDVTDALALANAHRDSHDADGVKTYYIVFVSGNFADASGPNPDVLAVSIGDTGVIVMFKEVIRSAGSGGLPNLDRFVEQSVLVHELGHGVGLVHNGVPMAAPHEDSAHPAHCTDDHCVLYYANGGASAMAQFAQQYVVSGNSILFDPQCLADVDAVNGGP